jgi:hypothetical protein
MVRAAIYLLGSQLNMFYKNANHASGNIPRKMPGYTLPSRQRQTSESGCRMTSEPRAEIFFTFVAGILLWSGSQASAFADHLLLSKGDARVAAKKVDGTQSAPLELCPGWRNRQPRRKRLKRPLSDKDVSVQIRPPDATFLVCPNT